VSSDIVLDVREDFMRKDQSAYSSVIFVKRVAKVPLFTSFCLQAWRGNGATQPGKGYTKQPRRRGKTNETQKGWWGGSRVGAAPTPTCGSQTKKLLLKGIS
jgi:hypothetical protein